MRAASIYSRRRGIKIIRNPTAGRPIYIFTRVGTMVGTWRCGMGQVTTKYTAPRNATHKSLTTISHLYTVTYYVGSPRPTLAVKTCPTRRPFPRQLSPGLTGPLTGVPRWETPQPPHRNPTHTRHHTQHHMRCWACPMYASQGYTHASYGMLGMPDVAAPRTPHSAHTQVPAAAYLRPGYRYSCTAVPPRSCRPSVRQHHGASGR